MRSPIESVALCFCAVAVSPAGAENRSNPVTLTPAQLFQFADDAVARGDFAVAEKAYRALAENPDIELRTEARFRLGMMLADRVGRPREAAVEFRKILDEKPSAARIRLELARMNALMGRLGAAEREFRAAQAAGLPPEVERMVRFYANALSAAKPVGASFEIALAPDSNINRATKSDTLGTIIGDFTLDDSAKAQSGVGLALRGQGYFRRPIGRRSALLLRLLGNGDFYRDNAFDDFSLGVLAGPELRRGTDKFAVSIGPTWRWYGTIPYSFSATATAGWQHPTGKRSQIKIDAGVAHVDNRRNDLQDAWSWSLSASFDRAFSARFGGGVQAYGVREAARDPGYATATGGVGAYLFREFGKTSAVLTLGYSHLEADARQFLYRARRIDNRFSASVAGTFRALRIGALAPLARVKWERNISTIELYDFDRIAGEFGVTAAF